jgi:hypothetical protein
MRGYSSASTMELTFIVSAVLIFLMITLRSLEIRFQRPIILAHLSWPIEKRFRVHAKKLPALGASLKASIAQVVRGIRTKLAEKFYSFQEGSTEYVANLQESLRGKRTLSRGSVSFFLLNISDYGNNRHKEPVDIAVESEERSRLGE